MPVVRRCTYTVNNNNYNFQLLLLLNHITIVSSNVSSRGCCCISWNMWNVSLKVSINLSKTVINENMCWYSYDWCLLDPLARMFSTQRTHAWTSMRSMTKYVYYYFNGLFTGLFWSYIVRVRTRMRLS